MTLDELREHFGDLEGCCLHSPTWTPNDATEVLFAVQTTYDYPARWEVGWEGGSDSSVLVAARLRDGYGLISSSEDYTGHGCQCGSYTGRFPSFSALLRDGVLPEV